MLIPHASTSFLRHCSEERGLAPNTLAAYRQDLLEFEGRFGDRDVRLVTGPDLVAYASHLVQVRRLAPATIKRRIACLRSLYAWLTRRSIVADNPFSRVDIRIRIPDRLPRCLSAQDMGRLVRAAEAGPDQTRLAVNLLLATGARVSELTAIRLRDVDPASGTIRIVGKGNKERQVFVPEGPVMDLLRTHVLDGAAAGSPDGRLLVAASGRPVTPAGVRAGMRKLSRSAGLARIVTPHVVRHTTATVLLEAGVDVRYVQKLLGHRSITTTQIYTHVSDQALKAAVVGADICRRVRP